MKNKKELILLVLILFLAAFLRFFNLMHDSPYFFDPDERNMANAINQFRLPNNPSRIPTCIISQFFSHQLDARRYTLDANNCNLNPHFFAYGQFPLYLSFVSDQIVKPISNYFLSSEPTTQNLQLTTNFPSSIFWLRFWSALTSTLTVLFVYLITKQITNNYMLKISNFKFQISNLAALSAAFTPGLIQSAHFGTTESLLTFLFLASIYLSLSYLSDLRNLKFVILTSLTIGLALGSKLTAIFFFIPPATALIIRIIEVLRKRGKAKVTLLLSYFVILCIIFIGSTFFFILSSPYNLVEPEDFKSAVFGYEQDVATGKYEAFYTRQFVNTTPILFQAEKIFPYSLGWPTFIMGTLGLIIILFEPTFAILSKICAVGLDFVVKLRKGKRELRFPKDFPRSLAYKIFPRTLFAKDEKVELKLFVITISFIIYLLPNAFLFAKWTRFMTPVFPFFSIFAGYAIFLFYKIISGLVAKYQRSNIKNQIYISKIKKSKIFNILYVFFIFNILFFILFPGIAFMSIYTHEDTRVTASKWIYQNIPDGSYVLSETANVVDIPLGLPNNLNTDKKNYKVISFDFYHMDENQLIFNDLLNHLEKASYIFIPSRRIFANYTRLPQKYPLVTKYYQLLFSGALGFEKITEISSFPRLQIGNWKLEIDDEHSEETYTVFDHPVIRIYRKVHGYTKDQYRSLLTTARID